MSFKKVLARACQRETEVSNAHKGRILTEKGKNKESQVLRLSIRESQRESPVCIRIDVAWKVVRGRYIYL